MSLALYDHIGTQYSSQRRPDARIASVIHGALGDCRSVVNVGAGTGSYEPMNRTVLSVDPSRTMLLQHPERGMVVQAVAENLPIRDSSSEAALAILTLHHWADWRRGIGELRRISTRRVVIVTWDPDHEGFWLGRYFPEILEIDRRIFPRLSDIAKALGRCDVVPLPIPHDCTDGFLGAYWRRPAAYLDPGVRSGISTFRRITNLPEGLRRLDDDLHTGAWDSMNQSITEREKLDVGYRVVVANAS